MVGDALDDLISQVQASISFLDNVGKVGVQPPPAAKAPPRWNAGAGASANSRIPAAGSKTATSVGSTNKAAARLAAKQRVEESRFWQPRCDAHQWGEGPDDCGSLGSLSDLDTESESEEEDPAWDFLRAASGPDTSKGGLGPRAAAAKACGVKAPQPPPARPAKRGAAGADFSKQRAENPPRNAGAAEAEEPRGTAGAARRGQEAGFRFGEKERKEGVGRVSPGDGGVARDADEEEIASTLASSMAKGGQDAARKAVKRLLLKWHPDKAPQGDGPEAVKARERATKALRFIIGERERLNL